MNLQIASKINTQQILKMGMYLLIYCAALILLLKVITELKTNEAIDTGGIIPSIEQPIEDMSP